jgi:uncharacterized membrane-anchored protein YhcB (DUF1043 family)
MTIEPGLVVLAVCALLGVGFVLGRLLGPTAAKHRDLSAKLETAQKEREFADASLEAAKADLARITSEREEYGAQVVDHFSATSELMRDLTVQYRAVYDQLTRGATSLCPESSVGLQTGLQPESLGEGARSESDADAPAAEAAPTSGA